MGSPVSHGASTCRWQRQPIEPVGVARDVIPVDPLRPWPPLPAPSWREPSKASRTRPQPAIAAVIDSPSRQDVREQDSVFEDDGTGQPVVRTALSIEARDGTLRIFLPPLQSGEDYVDLVAAIEDTAAAMHAPANEAPCSHACANSVTAAWTARKPNISWRPVSGRTPKNCTGWRA